MTVNYPYQPMHTAKAVSVERMQEILDKHKVNGGSESRPIAQPDGSKPCSTAFAILEWEKPVKGATGLKTKCGRYSCSKVTVNGVTTYELWRLVPGTWFHMIHKELPNFEKAKELAELDCLNAFK